MVEASWTRPQTVPSEKLSAKIRSWLLDEGSLTARLRVLHGDSFAVEPLDSGYVPILQSERTLLKLGSKQTAWARHVVLRGSGEPLILARSVLGGDSKDVESTLAELGTNSLGDYLFNAPNITKGVIEVASINSQTSLLASFPEVFLNCDQTLWARRCLYQIGLARLLVNEVYLPTIFQSQCSNSN